MKGVQLIVGNDSFCSFLKRFAPKPGAARWPAAARKGTFVQHQYDPSKLGSGTNKFVPFHVSSPKITCYRIVLVMLFPHPTEL